MPTVVFNGINYSAECGTLISELPAFRAIAALPCGGHGRCGKCAVKVSGSLSPLSDAEKRLLSDREVEEGFRLACRTIIEGDCVITLQLQSGEQIRTSGDMPEFLLQPAFSTLGVAVDIGTTTVAARLYDSTGVLLAEQSALNPQAAFGADVISRIEAALGGEQDALADTIRSSIDGIIKKMAADANRSAAEIDGVVITGNTVMLHLLTKTSTEPLSHAPFAAKRLFGETLSAQELGLVCLCPQTEVYLPPCIAAFIGADLLCALLSSELCKGEETSLLVDIGTNGEMALLHGGELFCCSTAAGPAFEGAGISMGMGGKNGAVDHVAVTDGKMVPHVIGDAAPVGICGSGIVDAVAALLELEILDETGYLEDDPAFIAPPVRLTAEDIRAVQLAKSAIHAGLRTLLRLKGLTPDDLSVLSVAGGFGSYLDIENAGRIGLIPSKLTNRVRVLGNAALVGASVILLCKAARRECEELCARAQVVELAANPVFAEEYMNRMMFEAE